MTTNIFDEYDNVLRTHTAKFGNNTILLFEVGSFYEMYSLGGDDALFDIYAVCDLLNIQVTRRNKNIVEVSRTNCLMAGFPSYCLEKFSRILVDSNYTVVVVSQTSPPPKPRREVTNILSPGVSLADTNDWNYMMCIFLFEAKRDLGVAISYMDVSTGESFLQELRPCKDIASHINRVLLSTSPREIRLVGCVKDDLLSRLDFGNAYVHNETGDARHEDIGNLFFQNQFLKKVYTQTGLLHPLEYINLERNPMLATAFVALLMFVSDHSEALVKRIGKPSVINEDTHLMLSSTSAVQLNVVIPQPNNRSPSLIGFLNRCKTAIGRRVFARLALNPKLNAEDINRQYNVQDKLFADGLYAHIRQALVGTIDAKRLLHKMEMSIASIADMVSFYKTLGKLESLAGLAVHIQEVAELPTLTTALWAGIDTHIDVAAAEGSITDRNIFRMDHCTELDELHATAKQLVGEITDMTTKVNALAGADVFKPDTNDRDGAHLVVTIKRYETFAKSHPEMASELVVKKVSPSSSCYKVFHNHTTRSHERLVFIQEGIKRKTQLVFNKFVADYVETHGSKMEELVQMIGDLDVWSTNVANAVDFGYVRPTLDTTTAVPFISATKLRHPLVERLHQHERYVPNDVHLANTGMLLYGVNASGKSCFMKSIGIAIIMACSGMYVACKDMRFFPFKSIHTRIPSGDDIARGRSTFTNEIMELRSILGTADENSLVIGDELCSGTETVSAMSIVSAGIVTLSAKGVAFVFASHLHGIVEIPDVATLQTSGKLRVCHMAVSYDDKNKRLVYDRLLEDGVGGTLYGLEVCRALDMDPNFIMMANRIRESLTETPFVPRGKSRYNARLFKDACVYCGKRGEDVHHIIEQHMANDKGFVGDFHKNALHNLVNICKACHNRMHQHEK